MFHEIFVLEKDRDALRFLWRDVSRRQNLRLRKERTSVRKDRLSRLC